jgi:hypothetical protein
MDSERTIILGPVAATIKDNHSTLVIDWSYDALYFKYYDEPYITISIGEKTQIDEIFKINTPEIKSKFKHLSYFAFDKLKSQRCYKNINNSLNELERIVDYFV